MDKKQELTERIEHQLHIFKNSHPGDRDVVRRQIITLATQYETLAGHKYKSPTLGYHPQHYSKTDHRSTFID